MPQTPDIDIVHLLADFAANAKYEDLPIAAREAAKRSLLDTIGVSFAASGLEPTVSKAVAVAKQTGGDEATIWAFGGRASAVMAAFANGALVHGLDYDDLTPWGQHCSSSIIPAVLAVAERQGGVSGERLITAIAIGQDVFARLLRFVDWKKDWNFSTVGGVFAATLAAGHVLGFDSKTMSSALGISTLQSAGLMEMIAGRGSDLRGIYAGFSAKGAVLSVLLAEQGIGGIDKAFEGPNGVMKCYFRGTYDRDAILNELGSNFLGAHTLYKRWPCVGNAHSHIKAALDILNENALRPEEIKEIKLFVGDFHQQMSEPLAERCAPATLADAKFSLPFLVAMAIANGGMAAGDFTEKQIKDPAVIALAQKMSLEVDRTLDWNGELPAGVMEIVAVDGRRWTKVGTNVPGTPENPMGWPEVIEKFRECAAVCVSEISEDRQDNLIRLAQTLEDLTNISDFITILR